MKSHVHVNKRTRPVQPIVGTITMDLTANQAKMLKRVLNHCDWYEAEKAGIATATELGELGDKLAELSVDASMSVDDIRATMFGGHR